MRACHAWRFFCVHVWLNGGGERWEGPPAAWKLLSASMHLHENGFASCSMSDAGKGHEQVHTCARSFLHPWGGQVLPYIHPENVPANRWICHGPMIGNVAGRTVRVCQFFIIYCGAMLQ